MAEQTQFELTTPLGSNVLLFHALEATEALSRVSEYELECLSDKSDINLDALLGKPVSLRVLQPDGGKRYFTGHVARFAHIGTRGRYQAYRASLRSWPWFLSRTADCRIFQSMTVPEIVKQVFADHSIAVFRDTLSGQYRKRDYCVQYRESDFDFISRLLEEEGIYYFFEHAENRCTLVLADAYSAHASSGELEFVENRQGGEETGHVASWRFERQVMPGKSTLIDYDFTKPSVKLEGSALVSADHEQGKHEVFDYPGGFEQVADGRHYSQVRIDEQHAQHELARGSTNDRKLAVGKLFKLKGHARRDQNREYLVTAARLRAVVEGHESTENGGSLFDCEFTALNAKQDFRPARLTPRPVVQGPQTAMVVGPAGDEIHTDKYGRVKVQFHWDRYGKKDEHSSCWVRVSHPWAGKNWGFVAIPRIGQEVIVEFLEGDPDRPIITGRVYNAEQMPPYELPANMTQTGIKTRSTKGGGTENFNEIRFEDKKGSEQLFIHAEKNQDIEVENDETHWVGHDRSKNVDHNETVAVGNDRKESVGNNETISIGNDRSESVGANETISVGANRSESVGKNESVSIAADRDMTVGANEVYDIGKDHTVTIGANQQLDVGKARNTSIGTNDSLQIGKVLLIEAGDEITLKTGSASITMKKDGTISIKGKDITISGSGKIGIKASGDVVVKGSKIAQN
ncbi:type VI secretion system tip protein VgrG [Azoarcus sp. TTM-91]|uniref:type VI secretion system tip protein TssI/VgrG n=1 Tax=Azoarcus sp. TTM-91 TaxID=2691581 RepID=UPI00145C6F67|nr:type VI secretion system tip protein VgrG [Azoarcus sp. TTM-91]